MGVGRRAEGIPDKQSRSSWSVQEKGCCQAPPSPTAASPGQKNSFTNVSARVKEEFAY